MAPISRRASWFFILLLCVPVDLPATDHLMVIQEIFPGTPANPDAQYVMLRMTHFNQPLVAADFVQVQDASGAVVGRFGTFPAAVSSGTSGCVYPNCPAILMGTAAAQSLLGFAFDVVVDAQVGRVPLPLTGGRVCFHTGTQPTSVADCVAFGDYAAANTIAIPTVNTCDADFGSPAAALTPGYALARRQFSCSTRENATDFQNRFPRPVANNGGNANIDSDADGLIDILDCDDVNGDAGLYPPSGVALLVAGGGTTATWNWSPDPAPVGTSLVYDMARMLITDLTTRPSCDAAAAAGQLVTGAGVVTNSVQESSLPAPGEIFYYVVRSRSTCESSLFC